MEIKIIKLDNTDKTNELASVIADELKNNSMASVEFSSDIDAEHICSFVEKNFYKNKKLITDAVYELITHIYHEGKGREYQHIVHNEFPNGLDFDKFIDYLYTHKAEILKSCGLS